MIQLMIFHMQYVTFPNNISHANAVVSVLLHGMELFKLTLLDTHACSLVLKRWFWFVNVNVNVSVYSLKSPLSSADFTIYAPGIGTLSYTVSSPLGENSAFAPLCCSYSQSLQFSFLVPPGTHHCWLDRGSVI